MLGIDDAKLPQRYKQPFIRQLNSSRPVLKYALVHPLDHTPVTFHDKPLRDVLTHGEVIIQFLNTWWREEAVMLWPQTLAADVVVTSPLGRLEGLPAAQRWYCHLLRWMPDLNFLLALIHEGDTPDKTVLHWSAHGSCPSRCPDGKTSFALVGMSIITVEQGRVVRMENVWDQQVLQDALGAPQRWGQFLI